jgi:hypothetical protein
LLNGVSTNGTSNLIIQLGDAGGIETTGYAGWNKRLGSASVISTNSTTALLLTTGTLATFSLVGTVTFTNVSSNNWLGVSQINSTTTDDTYISNTAKTLSDVLTQLRITTVGGTDTFDAGAVNIMWEF